MSADVIGDILSAMRAGVDYSFPLTVRDFTVTARPLSISETIKMTGSVMAVMQKTPENNRTNVFEASLLAKETLVIATRPTPDSPIEPALSHYVLDRMTSDELLALYAQYKDGCDKVNPSLEAMPARELLELVADVKKNPEAVTRLSRHHLAQVVRSLLTPGV